MMSGYHYLLLLVTAGSIFACEHDGKINMVKEIKSYQVQPNCTVKCSMYCEIDGFHFEHDLPLPVQTPKNQVSNKSRNKDLCETVTTPPPSPKAIFNTCQDALNKGYNISGVYTIQPDSLSPFDVYCDMETDGGGWTVFQRRQDGSEEFYRNWNNYTAGFENLSNEFWLGLDYIHRLTNGTSSELRIDLKDSSEEMRYAHYNSFQVGDASSKYVLQVSGYSGTAGDSLLHHNGRPFSTFDADNDICSCHCAVRYQAAWWYVKCHYSNLNGRYHIGAQDSYANHVIWYAWKGYYYSLKFSEMKIRDVA
jgi:ficolin